MNARLTMDRAGRVVLPKPIRDRLQLEPGEPLEIESFDDHLVLRPTRERSRGVMRKEMGIWVYDSGQPIEWSVIEDTMRKVREEREDDILGRKR